MFELRYSVKYLVVLTKNIKSPWRCRFNLIKWTVFFVRGRTKISPASLPYLYLLHVPCYFRLAYFERVSVFLTQENLVSQIRRHYTMQVILFLVDSFLRSFINFLNSLITIQTISFLYHSDLVSKMVKLFSRRVFVKCMCLSWA